MVSVLTTMVSIATAVAMVRPLELSRPWRVALQVLSAPALELALKSRGALLGQAQGLLQVKV